MNKKHWSLVGILWHLSLTIVLAGGHEGHGGGGIILNPDKLESGGETVGTVEIFDKLEYDKEFLVQEQAEYRSYVSAKLDILKTKLPRTGHFLEQVFLRGISPRWYFVAYQLKPISDVSDTTRLILTSERIQIAANDGTKIQIQEKFWKALEPKSRAMLLMHEGLRSAIGVEFFQSSDIVKSITSLLLHQNLDSFSAAAIANELQKTLSPCQKGGKNSPLFDLVFADSHFQPRTEAGWEDVSVLEDGITPTSCSFETDRCAFRDTTRGMVWTMVSPDKTLSPLLNYEQAAKACTNVNSYAGFYSWKIPTFSALKDFSQRIGDLVKNFPAFGNNNNVFWSKTAPDTDPWSSFINFQKPDSLKAWGVHLSSGQVREINRAAEIPYVCVIDQLQGWTDVSTNSGGTLNKNCTEVSDQCTFRDNRTTLSWTEPGPNYIQRYRGPRRLEDQGVVSRQVAVGLCDSLNWNNQTGWRLPSEREVLEARRDGLFSIALSHEVAGNIVGDFWIDASTDASTVRMSLKAQGVGEKNNTGASKSLARYLCVHE